jgi:HAD superfamily hydrolase (TIGR01509 family)
VIQAIVFDLDGVLVDSEPVWEQVRRRYVAEHGGTWQPDTQSRLMGMSTPEWARYLSQELGVARAPEQVAADVVEEMARQYAVAVPLIGATVPVIRRLAARWPLGVASSSPVRLIRAALDAADLAGTFRVALSTEQMRRGKPAPDVYLAAAAELGVDPAGCVAVEDSSNGVRSAANAGMRVVAVPHAAYPLDPDSAARATLTLTSIDQLTDQTIETLAEPGESAEPGAGGRRC